VEDQLTWQDEFHEALYEYIIEHGFPRSANRRYGTFTARNAIDLIEHMEGCPPSLKESSYGDTTWTEWGGTFGSDYQKTGLEALITCECGIVYQQPWLYEDGYAELIKMITRQ
jgi:hypothetical protein